MLCWPWDLLWCVFVMAVCALFVFESSRTTNKDKQPRGMHGARILIGGVFLGDCARWMNCSVYVCARCKSIGDEKRLLHAVNAPRMQWNRVSVPIHGSAQFLTIVNCSSLSRCQSAVQSAEDVLGRLGVKRNEKKRKKIV